MRISDWSSDVCSSDLIGQCIANVVFGARIAEADQLVSQNRDGRDLEPTMLGVVVTELRHRLRLALADPVARAADRLTLDMAIERNASQRRNATGAKTTEDRARTDRKSFATGKSVEYVSNTVVARE